MDKRLLVYTVVILTLAFFFSAFQIDGNSQEKRWQKKVTANMVQPVVDQPAIKPFNAICSATSIKSRLENLIGGNIEIKDLIDIQDYNAFVVVGEQSSSPDIFIYLYSLGNNQQLDFGNDDWHILIDKPTVTTVNNRYQYIIEAIASYSKAGQTMLLWSFEDVKASSLEVKICTIEQKCSDKQTIIKNSQSSIQLSMFLPVASPTGTQSAGVYMQAFSPPASNIVFCEFASGGQYSCSNQPATYKVIMPTYGTANMVLRDLGMNPLSSSSSGQGIIDRFSETFTSYASLGIPNSGMPPAGMPPAIFRSWGTYMFSGQFLLNQANSIFVTDMINKRTAVMETFQAESYCSQGGSCFIASDGGKLRVGYKGSNSNYFVKELTKQPRVILNDNRYSSKVNNFIALNKVQLIETIPWTNYDILLPDCYA